MRGLLAAQVASEVGDQFARVAVTLLVLERAGSTFLAALVLAVSYLPALVGGVVLGTLADRLPRRELLVACDLLRAALVGALALAVLGAPLWLPFVALLLVELVSVPFDAARAALLPDVAPQPRRLQSVVGVSRTLQQANLVVGLAAGGLLVAATSVRTALVIDAASYAVSALVLLLALRRRPRADGGASSSALRAVAEGARAVVSDPVRRALVALGWLLGAIAIAPEAVALTYAAQHDVPGAGGVLLAAVPLGGALGAAVSTALRPRRVLPLLLPLAAASCLPLLATAADPGLAAVLVLWFLAGLCQGVLLPSLMVLVNLVTPAGLRGRVSALGGAGFALVSAGGLAAAGLLADRTSAAWAVGVAGAVGLLVTGGVALVWPRPALAAAVARIDPPVAPRRPGPV